MPPSNNSANISNGRMGVPLLAELTGLTLKKTTGGGETPSRFHIARSPRMGPCASNVRRSTEGSDLPLDAQDAITQETVHKWGWGGAQSRPNMLTRQTD